MSRLIDEVRFETSLAATYIVELNDKFSTKEGDYSGFPGTFGVPGTAIALLSPQLENKPLLTQLFTDPIVPLPENRVLAGWFAAQLLDSALIRSVAAVDCIAVLLWSAAGCPFSTDGQFSFTLPDFRQSDLKLIESEYSSRPAWLSLYRLADHECVQIAGQYRHGFVHRRRAPTELHGGAEAVVRFGGGDAESTLSKGAQLAMVGKFYRDVLCVATGLAGELLLPGSSDDAN